MSRNSTSFNNSGAYTSPGTPDYKQNGVGGIPRGCCSERVPLPNNGGRSHISAAALMPFNSGRALPSKWDDAERWITSPMSGFGACKTQVAHSQRRPKSKSGPLGVTPGVACYSNYSPAVPVLEGGSTRNFLAGSPLTTGVLVTEGLSIHYGGGVNAHSNCANIDYEDAQSSGIPGWSELMIDCSFSSSLDEKLDGNSDAENTISRVISRRDMATQMSPVCSSPSPKGKSSLASSPSVPLIVEPGSNHSARVEVRDVQVDVGATMTRQAERHSARKNKKASADCKDLACDWDPSEGAMQMSKYVARIQKEEARIDAWENLQNAKAEAAIRKLEMNLEKKRSASMNKILNKLRAAQLKAQDMRTSLSGSPANQSPRHSFKVLSFHKYVKMSYLNGCFACHAS